MTTIGFYGFGNLATALVEGWNSDHRSSISFYRRDVESSKDIENKLSISFTSASELLSKSDVLFLAFKPQNLEQVKKDLNGKIIPSHIVSLLAGTSIASLRNAFPKAKSYTRMMPNTSSSYKEGSTGIFFDDSVPNQIKSFLISLMNECGSCVNVTEEHMMNTVTGISGSGPAFIYALAEEVNALNDDYGLSINEKQALFGQMLIGAGKLLVHSGKTPSELISAIKSKKGTTEAGLNALHERNVPKAFSEGIQAAIKRAYELGEQA